MMYRLKTDPARFEVVKNALTCAAEEMKIVLAKTAYSPLLKVAGDYSCGIFDTRGNMVAQGPDLPIHLGSMPDAVRAVVQAFPDVAPGDVFIHNDPYQGGSHLPDVNVVAPAFHEGRLLGFGCVRAHWPDIGSATPGSYGAVTEVYGEGLRLYVCIVTASRILASRRSSSRMSAHRQSGLVICGHRSRRTGVRRLGYRRWQ
jgi:N-methylhydantoinase B